LVGDAVPFIGDIVALVGGPLSGIGGVLRPIQGRGPSGQPGLGRLQRLLGCPGAGLSGPDPSVVDGHGSDPLTLGVLDDLLGQVGQLAAGRPRLFAELLERRIRADPPGAGKHALGLSIQTRLTSASRSRATSISRAASSAPVWIRSAVTAANAPSASISWADQARGLVV